MEALSSLPGPHDPAARQAFLAPLQLTVVVPVFNERDNVAELVRLLDIALAGIAWEVVFVDDDSPDQTADVVAAMGVQDRRIRHIRRIGRRGLSSACIEGILSSSAPYVAVMDGDLQHDETILPQMIDPLIGDRADLVVGSRYAQGGSVGAWSKDREGMSRFATRISRMVTGAALSDPMSGFFMLRRTAFNAISHDLSGLGFKILLDIVTARPRNLRIVEVPFTFRPRMAGESKLDTMVLWEFLMLLLDKSVGKMVPVRFISFAAVGGLGVLVHFAILTALFRGMSVSFFTAQTVATIFAMVSNYALNNIITYRDRCRRGWRWWTGLASFMAICALGGVANVGAANFLFTDKANWAAAAAMGIMVGAVWNYFVTSLYTWKK